MSSKGKKSKEEKPLVIEEIHEDNWKKILVSIDGLENIKGAYNVTNVFVQIEFMNKVLGESLQQPLTRDDFVPHFFDCILNVDPENYRLLDTLISNPVLFSVYQTEGQYDDTLLTMPQKPPTQEEPPIIVAEKSPKSPKDKAASKSKESGSKKGGGKGGAKEVIEEPEIQQELVGRSNLDLIPLFFGQTEIIEALVLEQEIVTLDDEIETHPKLPRLLLHITCEGSLIDLNIINSANVLHLSVESIFNPCPEMELDMYFTVATPMPLNNDELDAILINDGIVTDQINQDQAKMWPGLSGLLNRSSYTKYKIDQDTHLIKNPLNIDLEQTITATNKLHVEWNILRRLWIPEKSQEHIKKNLKKFRKWPLEIYATKKLNQPEIEPTVGTLKHEIIECHIKPPDSPEIPKIEEGDLHFMGYLDLTNLLYPGVTKTRIVCPLRTYNKIEMLNETGFSKTIFELSDVDPSTVKGKDGKSSKKDDKSSKKDDKSPKKKNKEEELLEPEPEPEPEPSVPLFSEDNQPTFIIIDVELKNPIYKKRSLEQLTTSLHNLVPARLPMPQCVIDAEIAEKNYKDCIEQLVRAIQKEYVIFQYKKNAEIPSSSTSGDEGDFFVHLKENGTLESFKTILLKKIATVVKEKFVFQGSKDDKIELQNYISNLYAYLITEMHLKVNNIYDQKVESVDDIHIGENKWLYFAKEAQEMKNYDTAQKYLLKRINFDRKNPDLWLDNAIFNLDLNKFPEAFEICREVLTLNVKHKYGLLLIAFLLMKENRLKDAEDVLLTLMTYYCNFLEGWVTLHMFYLKQDMLEGADVAYEMAKKCLDYDSKTVNPPTEDEFMNSEDLTWNTKLWKESQMYVKTAVIHLKLRAYDFVEIALAKDLTDTPNSASYSYYFAVAFFLQRRYRQSLEYLKEAVKIYGVDKYVGSLLGHCFYEMDEMDKAVECYETVLHSYDRDDDIHLIHMRLGNWYKNNNDNEKASNLFLLNCKYSPTPISWLEAGKCFLDMNRVHEAEECFTEANFLDNSVPEAWGYLALVNLKYGHKEHYNQCLDLALLNGLADEDLATKLGITLNTPKTKEFEKSKTSKTERPLFSDLTF